jgi:hypothetical protein
MPIAGLEGIPSTDGLTTSYQYDENLTDDIGRTVMTINPEGHTAIMK